MRAEIKRDAPHERQLKQGMESMALERQYRRERAAEVERQRRGRLRREGLERLSRDYDL